MKKLVIYVLPESPALNLGSVFEDEIMKKGTSATPSRRAI
jgi:hypothetical protein